MKDGGPHPGFVHEALYHDGPAELVGALAPDVRAGLQRGDAVLVCLPPPDWARLSSALGDRAADVRYLPPDIRYGRPGVAMATLHDFVGAALDDGATTAWSIGTIPFDGTPRDRRWLRYEHAVDDVLGHVPLRAVCTYDIATTPAALLAAARRAHQPSVAPLPPVEAAFELPPVLALTVEDVTSARRSIEAAFADAVDADALGDLLLVTSELLTNAVRHGAPPIGVRAWRTPGEAVIEVVDHGTGWPDRYPDLRPNRGTAAGGYGWWLIGQLADAVEVSRRDERTTVTVTMRR